MYNISMPYVVDGEGRKERQYDIFSRLLEERIVCLAQMSMIT